MDIAAMNEKITIQKNVPTVDAIGNHREVWTDYYTCHSTVSGEESSISSEAEEAGQRVEKGKIAFTVRWCSAVAAVTSTEYRVKFRDALFDITGIDHMNFKKKSVKIMCMKTRR